MRLLIFNAGSSSLKFQLFEASDAGLQPVVKGAVSGLGADALCRYQINATQEEERAHIADHAQAACWVFARMQRHFGPSWGRSIAATGHRVVHGGTLFTAPARVTPEVLAGIESLNPLAPLHNPAAVAVIRACQNELGAAHAAVAVFDTAFFHDLPDAARTYAVPAEWTSRFGIRRYGFHGIAHRYMYERYLEISAADKDASRIVTLQLGQGCSITALRGGNPLDTSMGFTPLEGLIMATRPGDVDAGVLLHLLEQGVSLPELSAGLHNRSGLLALSSASADMRTLLQLEAQGHEGAVRAVEAFCLRARKYLGAYVALLGGADAVIFGGGVGEHAPDIRARILRQMEWCGLLLDETANAAACGVEHRISATGSTLAAYVIPVDEEKLMAHDVRDCLGATA